MFWEISEMKGKGKWSLNSHFWLQLARLAFFLFVFLFLSFVVWGKSQIRVQLMPLSYCKLTEERAMIQQQCLGDANWLLLCSGMCIYSAMCPPVSNLLHCHPSLLISSFPRPPCYVSFWLAPLTSSPFLLARHHLPSWMCLRHSSGVTTSDLLNDPGWVGLSAFCNGPSAIRGERGLRWKEIGID